MREEFSEWILFRGLREAEDVGALVALAERYGFGGDLWRAHLAYELLRCENPWSLACEGASEPESTLSALAARDMERILRLYRNDALAAVPELRDYRPAAGRRGAARVVDELRAALDAAATGADAAHALADVYRRHGAGVFALHRAFRASEDGSLQPVPDETEPLSLLVGYEAQKA